MVSIEKEGRGWGGKRGEREELKAAKETEDGTETETETNTQSVYKEFSIWYKRKVVVELDIV